MTLNLGLQKEKGEEYWSKWDTYLTKEPDIVNAIVKHVTSCLLCYKIEKINK